MNMLSQYIQAAMRQAKYEILSDDGIFYGGIPDFQGVWVNAKTLKGCREELANVVEEWIFFNISARTPLPVVDDLGAYQPEIL